MPDSGRRPKTGRPEGRTTGRSELARNPRFAEISPELGVLDEDALNRAMADDASDTLALIASMSTATDERLRRSVQALAARLVLDRCRTGRPRRSGIGRLRVVPADRGGDLEMDASIEGIVGARAERRAPGLHELAATEWSKPELALVIVLDQSGSMNGARLATAAVAAAACALRTPGEYAVLSFARQVTVLKPLTGSSAPALTVDKVLRLRGHGVTGLASALRAAHEQLVSARASRRVVVLLSDCRATDDDDPVPAARALPELVILAPRDDAEHAAELAVAVGARLAEVAGPDDVPAALDQLLN